MKILNCYLKVKIMVYHGILVNKGVYMKKKILIPVIALILIISITIYLFASKKQKNIPLTKNVNVVPTMLDTIDSDSSWCATFQ